MAVAPDNPGSLAVWRKRRAGPQAGEFGQGIAVFDNGLMRPTVTTNGGSWSLSFDADSGTLYAHHGGSGPFSTGVRDLYRCAITESGVSLVHSFPRLAFTVGTNFQYAAGRFFFSGGVAMNAEPFSTAGIYSGSESSILVRPDPQSSRVFHLSVTNRLASLRAYDIETFVPLGSLTISNVVGTPSSLVRWGTNGLAFRASSNQVFIVRGSLIQPELKADLEVDILGPTEPLQTGQSAICLFFVKNNGPAIARNVRLTNSFAPQVEVEAFLATEGTCVVNNGRLLWNIPALPNGAEEVMAVLFRSAIPNALTLAADVVADTADSRKHNNSLKRILLMNEDISAESMVAFFLPANDIVWSSDLGKLLVTIGSNQVNWAGALASIDPANLSIRVERDLGPGAGKLAMANDGTRLYSALDFAFAELSLPSLELERRVALGALGAMDQALDLKILPGSPGSLVVLQRAGAAPATLPIYDGGIIRPSAVEVAYGDGVLAFAGNDPTRIYVQSHYLGGFRRYSVTDQGTSLIDFIQEFNPIFQPVRLTSAGSRIHTSLGKVFDPLTLEVIANLPGITNHSIACYDARTEQIFYLSSVGGGNAVLRSFDTTLLIERGNKQIQGISGTPGSLVRWGVDGLAFTTTGGQVFLLRSGLIPSGSPADLALSLAASEPLAEVGRNFVYSISVTNNGPSTAANVQLMADLSPSANSIVVETSQGTNSPSGRWITASLGDLPAGVAATIHISLVPDQPGVLSIQAKAISNSLDPDMENNAGSLNNSLLLTIPPDSVVLMDQVATDLAYCRATERLYVSSGTQISMVNPSRAYRETSWSLSGLAGQLALSDDGQLLYVVRGDGKHLWRINTHNGLVDFEMPSPNNTITDVKPIPGLPRSFVLSGNMDSWGTLVVYNDHSPRPTRDIGSSVVRALEFGAADNIAYANASSLSGGRRLRVLEIDSDGIREIAWKESLPSTLGDFKFAGGLLYAMSGEVIDPALPDIVEKSPV
jgi:uncharacterized repeat protein (TIGR01451 family)